MNLIVRLVLGGKGAGEESEEDLLSRMKTAIPPVTEETPAFRNYSYFQYCLQRFGTCHVLQRTAGNAHQQYYR